MDCKNQPQPSVIETLMGLNTQPVQKRQQQRVLSENYLQKASSLQFSHKSMLSRTCSSAMLVDVTDFVPTMRYMDQFCNTDYQICWSDSMLRSNLQDSQKTSLHPRHSRVVKQRSPLILENCPEKKISLEAKSPQKRKRIPLKPSKGSFSVNVYKVPEQDCTLEILNHKLGAPKISDSLISSLPSNRIRKEVNFGGPSPSPEKGKWIETHRSLIRPRALWDTNWHLISEECNKSVPSKTRLDIPECKVSSKPCNSEPVSANMNSSPWMMLKSECTKQSYSNESKRCNLNVPDGSNRVHEVFHDSSSCYELGRLEDCKMGLVTQTLATDNNETFSFIATQIERLICDADDICRVKYVLRDKCDILEVSHSLLEDTLASCQSPEPLSPTSSEVFRCSPISVLDSLLKGGVPSTMDCFMNGNTDLCEVYSEGLGMTISSDEDNQEEPMDVNEDAAELSDNSYLVSMLDVAFGHGDVKYTLWPSFEEPITPLVFQILEEKYGRHVSWPRSERKLLFDRINLGLTDIAKSCFGIRQISASVKQRFSACWTRKEVEENLWRLLVIQDKEATKINEPRPFEGENSTTKKGKKSNAITCKGIKGSDGDSCFLKLEDYMDEIIIDIERSLLDELVSEFL